ncbi:MAG: zeta toxin family protein [Succinivibrio sp.]|nr:zeta toxin family protein [Succinivibrio sp.]
MNYLDTPLLLIIAGPNGSGKSTLYEGFIKNNSGYHDVIFVNPDIITRDLARGRGYNSINEAPLLEQELINLQAARSALKLRERFLHERRSFAIETTASSPSILKLVEKAQNIGYKVEILYVIIRTCTINMQRVHARVMRGGHAVQDADIQRRYRRSLELLPKLIEVAKQACIFDNTQQLTMIFKKDSNGESFYLNEESRDFVDSLELINR